MRAWVAGSLGSFLFLLAPAARADSAESVSKPEHLAQAFIQYGLAFTGEFVASPGPMCNVPGPMPPPCILGTGGGLTLRIGRRLRSPFYIGAAYEFAKMDSGQIYRVGILQQARAEGRWFLATGSLVQPYLDASIGAAAYGNLWGIDTIGPAFGLGGGVELQLSTYVVIGLALSYRPMFFPEFTDSSTAQRPSGFSHLIALELVIETRDPF